MKVSILACDRHRERNELVTATEHLTVRTLHHGNVTLDLCDDCFRELESVFPFGANGKRPPQKKAPKQPSLKPSTNGASGELLRCPECGREAKSANALGIHRSKAHNVRSDKALKEAERRRKATAESFG